MVADKAMSQYGIEDPHRDAKAEAFLLERCEEAKRQLSRVASLMVVADRQGHEVEVSRSDLERETADLALQTEALLDKVLRDAEQAHGLVSQRRIQELEAQGEPSCRLSGQEAAPASLRRVYPDVDDR